MSQEIERKFLLRGEPWRGRPGTRFRQGYLSTHADRSVRVRLAGEAAFLTIKGRTRGAARLELEYAIPPAEAELMLDQLCERPLIEKTRYRLQHGDHVWEVDVFEGENAGLVVAEIELQHEDEPFARPEWLGEEVTQDARYYNANLVRQPYLDWKDA